jgi:hypothetical protein
VEDEGDGEAGPSPFMTRVNELVSALAAASRSVLREKEVMMQLLGCLYDVPHFGIRNRKYEELFDSDGHREVFVKNATFMATVKASLNSVRGWLWTEADAVDMAGMVTYYTDLQDRLKASAEEAVLELCRPVMDQYALDDHVMSKIAGLVGQLADTPNTTTVIARPTVTGGPAVREDFLGSDNFFILFKSLRELQSFIAFCDVLEAELPRVDPRHDSVRERARMACRKTEAGHTSLVIGPQGLNLLLRRCVFS